MRHSLQFRLLIAFTLVILLTIGAVFLMIWQATLGQIQKFSDRVEHMVSSRIQFTVSDYYLGHGGWDGIQPIVEQLGEQFRYRIILTDSGSKIIAYSQKTDPSEILDLGKFSSRTLYLLQDSQRQGQRLLPPREPTDTGPPGPPAWFSPGPAGNPPPGRPEQAPEGAAIIGYLMLLPMNQSEIGLTALQILYNEIGRYFLIGGLLAVIVSLLVTFFMSRRVLQPIKALTSAARQMGKGDLSQRVAIHDRSEIGELASTFNLMAGNLEHDEQLRRHMVSDIAHELRSPLTNMRGYLEAISDGVMQPDAGTIGTIYDETILLARLVDDLQELSLAEAGELKLYRQAENPAELVRQAISAVQPKAKEKDLNLSTELPEGLPPVNIDFLRIKQVLLNLLENAIAYTPARGGIKVSASKDLDFVEISVADSGPGIPPDELENIFERFHRVDRSRARATGGSGLGLTIARYLVEEHGGKILAQSEPGGGARFCFTIPVMK